MSVRCNIVIALPWFFLGMSKCINLGSLKESVSKALRFVLMHWELFTRVDIAKVVLPEGRESCWEVLFCPETT